MGYRWVKFRTRHSAGPGRWQYDEMSLETGPGARSLKKQLMSFLNEKDNELSTYSEHWRGIEGVFEDPPADVLKKKIIRARQDRSWLLKKMQRWQGQL